MINISLYPSTILHRERSISSKDCSLDSGLGFCRHIYDVSNTSETDRTLSQESLTSFHSLKLLNEFLIIAEKTHRKTFYNPFRSIIRKNTLYFCLLYVSLEIRRNDEKN